MPLIFVVWRQHVKKWFGISVHDLPPQEWGKLTLLRNQLGKATLAVVEHAVEHWEAFAKKECSLAGHGGWPNAPSIGFLVAHRRAAFAMTYHTSLQKSPKTARDFRVIEQAVVLEQYWGKL